MKTSFVTFGLLLSAACVTFGQTSKQNVSAKPDSSAPTSFAVIERGRHYKIVESARQKTNDLGQIIMATNRYTAIGNGMNFQDASGNWIESRPVVQSFPNTIICSGASYRAILNQNLNTYGAVDLEMNDQQRIVSHPVGLAFYDPESGRSVWLALVKDCPAEIVSTNRIVYRDAFSGNGIEASITYGYDIGRFHQDLTFQKRMSLTPADFGMSERTRLELVTEIVQSPEPVKKTRVLKRETDPAQRARMVEPDVTSETLKFGKMMMPAGYAFESDDAGTINKRTRLPVAKQWLEIEGRRVLIESLEWRDAKVELDKLPSRVASANRERSWQAHLGRQLPETKFAQVKASFKTHMAEATHSRPSSTFAALDHKQTTRNLPNRPLQNG